MREPRFHEVEGRSLAYWGLAALLAAIVAAGLTAAYFMEHIGHIITGMTNQIVWGVPHVVAVFLIVSASGVLNVASIASVFGKAPYKLLARLSALLAIALLIGGLSILVLDLGHPDRLIVAMTHYNFTSIFAWNIFLYLGFIAVSAAYLLVMMERRLNSYSRPVGMVAFLWRLVLTTGTGSIFGFLVSREAYDEAILAPLFVAMSFSFGLAIFIIVLMAAYRWTQRPLGGAILERLRNLLGVFAAGVLYFLLVYHVTKLYEAKHRGFEYFILGTGGIYTLLFWIGAIFLGGMVPIFLFYLARYRHSRAAIGAGALAIILGGLALIYDTIIGAQAYPLTIFPGMQVSSSFYDGVVNAYTPSLPECALGLGGVALTLLIVVSAVRLFRILPENLADIAFDLDPHEIGATPNRGALWAPADGR